MPQNELNKEYVQKYLVSRIASQTTPPMDADKIDVRDDVRMYGLDSIRQMQLIRELEDKYKSFFSSFFLFSSLSLVIVSFLIVNTYDCVW